MFWGVYKPFSNTSRSILIKEYHWCDILHSTLAAHRFALFVVILHPHWDEDDRGDYDDDDWWWWWLMMMIDDDDDWWWWCLMMMMIDDDDEWWLMMVWWFDSAWLILSWTGRSNYSLAAAAGACFVERGSEWDRQLRVWRPAIAAKNE